MAKRQRLTNNSDETDLATLLSGDSVFLIPYFQRAYKWKPERLKQLNEDLLGLVDESSDFHFLGAIIIHGRRSNPSEPDVYEVIDGQQRVTTLFIYLCAAVKVLAAHEEYTEAAGLFLKYLIISRDTGMMTNSRLQPCKDDRALLNFVFADMLSNKAFAEHLKPHTYKQMPTTASDRGPLRNNYRSALRFFSSQAEHEGLDRVRQIYKALLEQMSVVQIDVWDPTNGPKIFDSLNSRQEPMTTGDLVRNEIFSRIAHEAPEKIEAMDQRSWQPFYGKFKIEGHKPLFDGFFFPYGLIKDPNLRKSEVYSHLRDEWRSVEDPEAIVAQLAEFQDAFLDIATGGNRQKHEKEVAERMRRLNSLGLPSSTYPFLMQLLNATKAEAVSKKNAIDVLELIESFLVRRAICGHEPTGLHAVFKRLWKDCDDAPTGLKVAAAIRRHRTVVWPSDKDVRECVTSRPLYGVSVTPHLLKEFNRSLGGDIPTEEPWIEHVLPEKPVETWFTDFSKEEHIEQKDLLANLLPLSPTGNREVGNKEYEKKREAFADDSGFKAARDFAKQYAIWTPTDLAARGEALAAWVLKRFSS